MAAPDISIGEEVMNEGKGCAEVFTPLETSTNQVIFCHLNAQNLMNKMDDLCPILTEAKRPVVLGISETWLDHSITTSEVSIPLYIFHCHNRGSRSSGILVYTPANCWGKRRADLEAEDIEVIWLELHLPKRTLLLGTFYCAPSANTKMLDSFAGMLKRAPRNRRKGL